MSSDEMRCSYLQTGTFQAVRLPYGKGRVAMYIFLPKSHSGLKSFLKTATAAQWAKWMAQMRPSEVNLSLPRFHADYSETLNNPLSQMGMAFSFGGDADFSPMDLPGSYISAGLHKATLDMDEEGTVATAATAVILQESAVLAPAEMHMDHAFFCAIRDDATGTILFLGAIRDPQ